jgi:hypothetical protein
MKTRHELLSDDRSRRADSSFLAFHRCIGLTLVFGVLKILNIAHGSFYALGAYIAATAVTTVAAHSLPPSVGFVAMLVSVALIASAVGLLLERGLLENVLWPRRSGVAAGDLCGVSHSRGRHQADLGRKPDLRDAAL